ncbi:MAG: O-antigen ligase family protein [Saprospiraceae bacterium]
MILSKRQHEAIHQSLLMLFCFLLPLHPRLSVLAIIFLGINWLLSGRIYFNFKSFLSPIPILFFSFYVLHLIGLIYTSNWIEGMQRVETKLPLLIFPLILFSFPIRNEKSISPILKSYVAGCLIASIYCLANGFLKYIETDENWMTYKKLGSFLGFHPTYYSMYLSFAFFIVLFFLIEKIKTHSVNYKIGSGILAGWFSIIIILLSSRMTILATVSILGISFLTWMYFQQKIWKGIGISILAIVLLFFSIKNIPSVGQRTQNTINSAVNKDSNKMNRAPRINLWNAALTVIKENPMIGTGTGDMQDEVVKIYKKRNYERALKDNFNPHSQYLQTTATLGIIGGVLLLFYLLVPFWLTFQQRDYLYLLFLSLVMMSFLTESILQTQRGTLFFGFFHTFLAMRFLEIKKPKIGT